MPESFRSGAPTGHRQIDRPARDKIGDDVAADGRGREAGMALAEGMDDIAAG
ncbi:hypothetical protein NOF55_02090 [Rhizobiaceae bacterium BDR2-2]|uniref:Uncharacterized protein n=1 Tax=Ectorhizobium quercum TaxID=2965071 RepID=A0AAE3STP6_9HYPH|nr:hypothetical protein [Ectorhizobium quercum]MCX8995888.1 hypothetical protein [Ectorhizobium quercum]